MAYVPLHPLPIQYVNLDGTPMSGGTIEVYRAGTSTGTPLFSDDQGTSVGSTITLNSRGMPQSGGNVITLFRDEAIAYKFILKNAAGALISTSDPIPALGSFDSDSSDKLDGIEAGADVTDEENVSAVIDGRNEIWIPASVMYAPTTNPAANTMSELSSGVAVNTWNFDGATEENVQFCYALPKRWDTNAIQFQVFWTRTTAQTAGLDMVSWGCKALAVTVDDTLTAAWGAEVTVTTDTAQSDNDLWHSTESSDVTPAGNAGEGELIFFNIARKTGVDDMDVDASLLGVKIFYVADKLNDA